MESIVFSILKYALLVIAVIMTFFILLQEGKGGGLSALGGTKGASVEGVTNPIRRATAYLAFLFFLLAIVLGIMANKAGSTTSDDLFKNQGADAKGAGDSKPQVPGPMDMGPGAPGMLPPMDLDAMAPPAGAEAIVEIPPKGVEKPVSKTEAPAESKTATGLESKTPGKTEPKTGASEEPKSGMGLESKTTGKTESKSGAPEAPKPEALPAPKLEEKKTSAPPAAVGTPKSDAPSPPLQAPK